MNEKNDDWIPPVPQEKQTLLKKYDIPVAHMDFDYVEKCKNAGELEKIVHILQSGEEGYFPALLKKSEERLALIKPTSKFIRKCTRIIDKTFLDNEERDELQDDLNSWLHDMSLTNKELVTIKKHSSNNHDLPEIRKFKSVQEIAKPINQRIKSTDYKSWDRYDPDTELLKMEIEAEKFQTMQKELANKSAKKVQFTQFQTNAEAVYLSNKEREKGNEYFKESDFKLALECYNTSITYAPSVANYNNRAITHMKLNMHEKAIEDCKRALKYEANNVKAWLRMAQCYDILKNNDEAIVCAEKVILINPNNTVAQNLINRLDTNRKCKSKTRFKIMEIDNETHNRRGTYKKPSHKSILKHRGTVLLPIPGPSTMPEPYYVAVESKCSSVIKEQQYLLNNRPQLLHFTNIYNNEDSDGDCEVIHILPSKDKLNKINNEIDDKNENNGKESVKCVKKSNSLEEIYTKVESINNINKTKLDNRAGGEPHINTENTIILENDLNLPYSFLQLWKSIEKDESYINQANILKRIDTNRLNELITSKLDGSMLTCIIRTLYMHFTVPHEVERVHNILENLAQVARFDVIKLFLTTNDRNKLKSIFEFLEQHGQPLSSELTSRYI